ncbi:YhgE/Pip domain-containing protein [Microbacterium marinilacus]|uniref:YhgE/Pip domain-containing protein n=1 Tax=Microbacterium marinilacus TaxID=415209 RepID=A0ABP7BCJ7_9MICO|nr:YhgE/Pip domain-containing protein [Microbacterium marinilacus]MBY0686956.1 YhgE/Pip domain-containing protein [Microbacterium marinilacus]
MTFLQTGIERARSAKPVTWLTLVGVLLLPALVGGVLVAALYNPTERLDNMTAAIVNLDEPVTIQDQYTPLGRQLSAGLVEGSDDIDSNLTWVLSNEEDAAEGLDDGTYQAVVTIPEEFSAAATSSGQRLSGEDEEPEQATIQVVTAPDARLVDQAITDQIASVATASMGQMLSEATLSNVLIGFTTLNEQLGEAADGASQLADGAGEARDGATSLADGASQLADGAGQLGTGAGSLADGAGQLASGAGELSTGASGVADGAAELATGVNGVADGAGGLAGGASQLADGAGQLSGGANELSGGAADLAGGASGVADGAAGLADGVGTLASGTRDAAAGATEIATGLENGAATIERDGLVPAELTTGAAGVAEGVAGLATGLDQLSQQCAAAGGAEQFCAQLAATAGGATDLSGGATQVSDGVGALAAQLPAGIATQLRTAAAGAGELASGLTQLADGGDEAAAGAGELASGADQLATGATALSSGAGELASGASGLSDGAGELSGGASQLADGAAQAAGGASQLSDGAGQLATGASGLATGTSQLASGAGELSTGAGSLSTGAGELADGTSQLGSGIGELWNGTRELASGLDEATEQIPTYTEDEADDIATVVADPVSASSGTGVTMFGASAIPLLAAIVLWFGGLATFVALRSVTARALTSRRASVLLAGGALLPAALVGAVQGVLVAAVIQAVGGYEAGTAWTLFGLCALIGVAFAAVHQALVAVLGGAGRWVAALVGAVALATGIVSTLPGWLSQLSGALPTAPAYRALLGAVTDAGGTGGAVAGLIVWAVLAFIVTILAVARRRTVSTKALLAGSPA